MNILEANTKILFKEPIIATIGMFDGVHLGHKKLIKEIANKASKIEGKSLLISFDVHPKIILFNDDSIKLLNTNKEKKHHLNKSSLDYYIPLNFTKEFAELSALEFTEKILVNQLNIHTLIVGHDHHFGKNRQGNYKQLKEYANRFNFNVEQISVIKNNDIDISSTKIRKALQQGNISLANTMLGYNYVISGTVIKGKQKGKQLGFPTANIEVNKYKLLPKNGAYIATVLLNNKEYKAMVNIGFQPTFNYTKKQVEVNILDFNKDIYNEEITISIKDFLREEKTFLNAEALQEQLKKDKEKTLQYFTLN